MADTTRIATPESPLADARRNLINTALPCETISIATDNGFGPTTRVYYSVPEYIRRMIPVAEEQQEPAEDGRNRRRYERVRVTRPIKLEATLRGRFIDILRIEMTGVTIDVSGGGFCATVDQSISPGVRCRIELTDEDGGEPQNLWGRVRRTDSSGSGYIVALEFDDPAEAAKVLRESIGATGNEEE